MSAPDSELEKHLRALFGGLDAGPDFDARLMARLRTESQADAIERAARTRQQEQVRYRRAVADLQNRRRSTLRLLTFDTLGIAFLLTVALVTAWPHLGPYVMDVSRQYGPHLVMLLGVLIAAVPLLGMWAEQTRRAIWLF